MRCESASDQKSQSRASHFGGTISRRRSTKRTQLGFGLSTKTVAARAFAFAIVSGQKAQIGRVSAPER